MHRQLEMSGFWLSFSLLLLFVSVSSRTLRQDHDTVNVLKIILQPNEVNDDETSDYKGNSNTESHRSGVNDADIVIDTLNNETDDSEYEEHDKAQDNKETDQDAKKDYHEESNKEEQSDHADGREANKRQTPGLAVNARGAPSLLGSEEVLLELQILANKGLEQEQELFNVGETLKGLSFGGDGDTQSYTVAEDEEEGDREYNYSSDYSNAIEQEEEFIQVIFIPKRQHTQFFNTKPEVLLPKRQHTQFFNSEDDISLPKRQHTQFFNSEDDLSLPKRQHTQFFNSEDDISLPKRQHTQFFNSEGDLSLPKRQHTQFLNDNDYLTFLERQNTQFLNSDGLLLDKRDEDSTASSGDIIKVIILPKGRRKQSSQRRSVAERKQHTTFYKVPGSNIQLSVELVLDGVGEGPGEIKAGPNGYTIFREDKETENDNNED